MDSHQLAPVVLLHGFGDSPECWSPLIAAIDDELEVSTPAAPGHAGERMQPATALTLGYVVDAALVHVQAAVDRASRPVVLGGHSMGAATAVGIAAEHPELVAALYLEDPPWLWPPGSGPDPTAAQYTVELAEWIAGLQGSSHEDRVQWCLDHNPGWPGDEYDIWARAKEEVDPEVFAHPIDLGRFAWQAPVDRVSCPATILVGDYELGSACMPQVAEYLERLPNWRVLRIPGAGHDVRRMNRAATIDALLAILRHVS